MQPGMPLDHTYAILLGKGAVFEVYVRELKQGWKHDSP